MNERTVWVLKHVSGLYWQFSHHWPKLTDDLAKAATFHNEQGAKASRGWFRDPATKQLFTAIPVVVTFREEIP